MRERVLRVGTANFKRADFNGKNESHIWPIGDLVLVMMDVVDGKLGKSSLYMPNSSERDQNLGAQSGVIVAVGPDAFVWSADRNRPFGEDKPKVGDRVMFTRYAGGDERMGADEKKYRVMSDNSIIARVSETEIAKNV